MSNYSQTQAPQDTFFNWERTPYGKIWLENKKCLPQLKLKKKRKSPEGDAQRGFFYWIGYEYHDLRMYCFAIPNGGSRHKLEAMNLQRQGVMPGVPDIFCAIPRGPFHGLFIEIKVGKNKLTPSQKQMIERLKRHDYACEICYGWEEAKKAFENYMAEK